MKTSAISPRCLRFLFSQNSLCFHCPAHLGRSGTSVLDGTLARLGVPLKISILKRYPVIRWQFHKRTVMFLCVFQSCGILFPAISTESVNSIFFSNLQKYPRILSGNHRKSVFHPLPRFCHHPWSDMGCSRYWKLIKSYKLLCSIPTSTSMLLMI